MLNCSQTWLSALFGFILATLQDTLRHPPKYRVVDYTLIALKLPNNSVCNASHIACTISFQNYFDSIKSFRF